MSGFVLLHRKVLSNPAFNNDAEAMAFAWMVLRAAWRDTEVRYKGRMIQLKRGQLALSVRDFAGEWGWSKDKCVRLLQRLNRDTIATDVRTGVNVVTILNYDKYQAVEKVTATATGQQSPQDRDRTATQNKEGNQGKEIKGGRASRLPSNFEVPAEWIDWAVSERGWRQSEVADEAAGFVDYWSAKAGSGATKTDWQATWRNWIRKSHRQPQAKAPVVPL